MIEIDEKVLRMSKQNINTAKAPKKGQSYFSNEVEPEEIKKEVIRLDESLSKYEEIQNNRNSFAMGLSERCRKHRELCLRSLKRKYKISVDF